MNQLQFQKTPKASFDILGDRLKVIEFLKKSGRFHTFPDLYRQLGIPARRLRDILNNRCEGYVARQGDHYGFFRTERKVVAPERGFNLVAPKPQKEKTSTPKNKSNLASPKPKRRQSVKHKLEQLRKEAYEQIKQRPNITDERAWLMAYQQHPDLF